MEAKKFAPMLSKDQALELLLAAAHPVSGQETIDTLSANGRVLAQDQVSNLNVPSFDNSQMDGYALRAADCQQPGTRLRLTGRVAAGQLGQPLEAGCCARIFTGAGIPPGADCVVMQEACAAEDGWVTINHVPQASEWVRHTGEDIRAGGVILTAGTRLRAAELGLAASVGLAQLPVMRRLKVAVFFTGDELVMPGEALRPGAIYNSNRFILRGLLENLGCQIGDYGIVPDTLDATRQALRQAAHDHDLIITSGGVSVGEEDHVKPAVEAEGSLRLWQIAIKPGKPLAFGQVRRSDDLATAQISAAGGSDMVAETSAAPAVDLASHAAFIGLPGNPVSSLITFMLFVRPFILRLQGMAASTPPDCQLRADFDWPKADRRNEFLRARRNSSGGLDLFANQGSAVLTSAVWADGIIDNPPGQAIARGDLVRFIPFNDLLF